MKLLFQYVKKEKLQFFPIGNKLMDHQNTRTNIEHKQSIDYLVVGHLTADLTEDGTKLGGTVAFSGLTGHALGLQTGIITSCSEDLNRESINSLWINIKKANKSTTFENISDGVNRKQFLFHIAENLSVNDMPAMTRTPKILHLGPVANEVDPKILDFFPNSLKCLTPQGWFRKRNKENLVELHQWDECEKVLPKADAAVISIEDVKRNEDLISKMASSLPIFVVTENFLGARVYWHNDARFFSAPEVKYADDTGAGDIFAAAFFYRYYMTKNPWEAGRFAVLLASWSVTRHHLESIPTTGEIAKAKYELMAS